MRPGRQRQDIGKALLGRATKAYALLPLWMLQKSAAAIRFYLAQGFREIERTEGSRNEEREPDVLFEWVRG